MEENVVQWCKLHMVMHIIYWIYFWIRLYRLKRRKKNLKCMSRRVYWRRGLTYLESTFKEKHERLFEEDESNDDVVFDFVGCKLERKQHSLNLSYNRIKWKLAQVAKNSIYMYHVKEITQWMQSIPTFEVVTLSSPSLGLLSPPIPSFSSICKVMKFY